MIWKHIPEVLVKLNKALTVGNLVSVDFTHYMMLGYWHSGFSKWYSCHTWGVYIYAKWSLWFVIYCSTWAVIQCRGETVTTSSYRLQLRWTLFSFPIEKSHSGHSAESARFAETKISVIIRDKTSHFFKKWVHSEDICRHHIVHFN